MGPSWVHSLDPGSLYHGEGQVILSHQDMFKTGGQGNVLVVANPVTPVTISHSERCNC